MRLTSTLITLIACSCAAAAPRPQNPSPMREETRSHQRIEKREPQGTRTTLQGVLPKPVEILITEKAEKEADLLLHFHGASFIPFIAAEQSGLPLIVAGVHLGGGSGAYDAPFRDASTFSALVGAIEKASGKKVRRRYATAFSAGYGAVRAVLRHAPDAFDGVLLLDGMHASYVPERTPLAAGGKIDERDLLPFLEYARRAAAGEKTFLITHSEIFPGTFVSTTESADWILEKLALEPRAVLEWGPNGMQQLREARRNRLQVLGYAGNTAPDHIDHLHALPALLPKLLQD